MSYKVLLVEDDPVSQKIVESVLGKIQAEVIITSTANEAELQLAKNEFDLVIMDVNLPDSSGLEITKKVRKSESGTNKRTLIVALTGNNSDNDRSDCLAAGMDGYFSKPINRMQFMDFLKNVLKSSPGK